MAQNKTYEWSISNVRSRDANFHDSDNGKNGFWYVELLDANGNHVDSVGAGGSIRANVYCNFELTVTAETYTDTCSVVVGGDVTQISSGPRDDPESRRAASPSPRSSLPWTASSRVVNG